MADPFVPAALDVPDEVVAERVVIRPFCRADAPALMVAVDESREHIRPWLPFWDGHRRIDDSIDYCVKTAAEWQRRESFGGGVFLRADGRLLGGAGVHVRSWPARGFEIGYWLRASATGQGYMREAAAALTSFVFDALGGKRVMIRCDAENHRSARVAGALGYVLEGRFRRDSVSPDGDLRDTLVFSMLREEWAARGRPFA